MVLDMESVTGTGLIAILIIMVLWISVFFVMAIEAVSKK
jgi:hypothetical protein